eukprot:6782176-Prymnesium_polylepis.1
MSARPRANRGPRHHALPDALPRAESLRLGRGPALIIVFALEVSLDVGGYSNGHAPCAWSTSHTAW